MDNPQGGFRGILLLILLKFLFSKLLYITKLVSSKAHMDIHSPDFDDLMLIQIDLLNIIFDTGASLFISPYKTD